MIIERGKVTGKKTLPLKRDTKFTGGHIEDLEKSTFKLVASAGHTSCTKASTTIRDSSQLELIETSNPPKTTQRPPRIYR